MKIKTVVGLLSCLLLMACGSEGGDVPSDDGANELPRNDVRDTDVLYPYRRDSAYNDDLKDCTLVENVDQICTLQRLPYIGQSGNIVSLADVMDRVQVTHDWMGRRFETLLEQAPDDMLAQKFQAPIPIVNSYCWNWNEVAGITRVSHSSISIRYCRTYLL